MAGHSKWANIKHRKAAADAKKGKVTTRIVKEITIAAKNGGDPDANPRLRLAIEKARENNVPKDNVERAIKRGTGELEGVNYEEIRFEGYGINGVGVIVDCLTDNKTRTVADIRHAFNKYGGNLGTDGCVLFQFTHCGLLVFGPDTDENKIMEIALDLDALDVVVKIDGSIEVLTEPAKFLDTKLKLDSLGFKSEFAEIIMRSNNDVELNGVDAEKMQKMLDAFDDLDDVQDVYTNAVINL